MIKMGKTIDAVLGHLKYYELPYVVVGASLAVIAATGVAASASAQEKPKEEISSIQTIIKLYGLGMDKCM